MFGKTSRWRHRSSNWLSWVCLIWWVKYTDIGSTLRCNFRRWNSPIPSTSQKILDPPAPMFRSIWSTTALSILRTSRKSCVGTGPKQISETPLRASLDSERLMASETLLMGKQAPETRVLTKTKTRCKKAQHLFTPSISASVQTSADFFWLKTLRKCHPGRTSNCSPKSTKTSCSAPFPWL